MTETTWSSIWFRLKLLARVWLNDATRPYRIRVRAMRWKKLGVFTKLRKKLYPVPRLIQGTYDNMLGGGLAGMLSQQAMGRQQLESLYRNQQQDASITSKAFGSMQQAGLHQSLHQSSSHGLGEDVAALLRTQSTVKKV